VETNLKENQEKRGLQKRLIRAEKKGGRPSKIRKEWDALGGQILKRHARKHPGGEKKKKTSKRKEGGEGGKKQWAGSVEGKPRPENSPQKPKEKRKKKKAIGAYGGDGKKKLKKKPQLREEKSNRDGKQGGTQEDIGKKNKKKNLCKGVPQGRKKAFFKEKGDGLLGGNEGMRGGKMTDQERRLGVGGGGGGVGGGGCGGVLTRGRKKRYVGFFGGEEVGFRGVLGKTTSAKSSR